MKTIGGEEMTVKGGDRRRCEWVRGKRGRGRNGNRGRLSGGRGKNRSKSRMTMKKGTKEAQSTRIGSELMLNISQWRSKL